MAIFEKDTSHTKQYVALMDETGEIMLAVVNPTAKGVTAEMLVEAMLIKGLNVELRESKPEVTQIRL